MDVTFMDDDGNLAAEFFVALLDQAGVFVEPGIGLVAQMQEWHAGFGQRAEIVERRGL